MRATGRVVDPHQPAGLLRLRLPAGFIDPAIVSEFALHHLPDFWKRRWRWHAGFAALKPGAQFLPARHHRVRRGMPGGVDRDVVGPLARSRTTHFEREKREGQRTMRDEYSTFGWVIERMLTDVGFTLESVDYHAPLRGNLSLAQTGKPDHQQS